MPRKVFLSVLGSSPYVPVRYFHGDKPAGNEPVLNFVQEANIFKNCLDWTENDYAYFFVTKGEKGSRIRNWDHPAQSNNEKISEKYHGLSHRLDSLNLKFKYEPVDIKDGNTEKEIWEIFSTVFNKLKDGDELHFDVTHAFRSIPLLVMVLINYAKFLKNVKVEKIYYGAFESLGSPADVVKIPVEKRFVPVLDLTSLSELQDWTKAASDFVDFGSVKRITELTEAQTLPLLLRTLDNDEFVYQLKKLDLHLKSFVDNILLCRGEEIIRNQNGATINSLINSIKPDEIAPLKPLLEKIAKSIAPYNEENQIKTGLKAVNWCINNNLIQQGLTILKETLVTIVCEECGIDHLKYLNREIVGYAFKIINNNQPENKWDRTAKENLHLTRHIIEKSSIILKLHKEFDRIRHIRNDINHAGHVSNPSSASQFDLDLKRLYPIIMKKLNSDAH